MTRKKFDDEPEHHDRWLVSYADFITLLFAFFVVMYAISSVNEGKYRVLSNALSSAFGRDIAAPRTREIETPELMNLPLPKLRRTPPPMVDPAIKKERTYMTGMARDLLKALAPLVSQGKVRVTQSARGVTVEINASVLFAPGAANLSEESSQALRAVANVLKDDRHAIQIEGHTDNLPISNALFPSNWELSAVRAASVVRLFIDAGIDESRMTAVGHGSTQPVQSNDTPEGRLRNRRVQLMILSGLPEQVTEVPISESASK